MANYKNKNKVFNVNACHLLCLLPIVLFSYYKNGYLVYKANYMSFFSTLEYLIIPSAQRNAKAPTVSVGL